MSVAVTAVHSPVLWCTGFLINLRASAAAYLSVQLLSKSVGGEKEKNKLKLFLMLKGKSIKGKKSKHSKDTASFNDLLLGIGVFLLSS